jgi:hypothetical protein
MAAATEAIAKGTGADEDNDAYAIGTVVGAWTTMVRAGIPS